MLTLKAAPNGVAFFVYCTLKRNAMKRFIGSSLLKLSGWKVTGRYPKEIKKFIILVAPHTSNWDFPKGIIYNWSEGLDIKFIAKHTLFKPGIGWFFKYLGGYPVNRTKRTNFAQSVVDIFNSKDEFVITLAAEGKRARVKRFKSGIYFIARNANVPIIPTKFNYATKEMHFGEPFYTTDNKEKDLNYLWDYFVGVQGKIPQNGIFPREEETSTKPAS